jgi:hypothetical protein
MFSGGSISVEDVDKAPGFKEKVKLVFISYGSRELENPRRGSWGDPKENTDKLKEAGMNTHFYVSPQTAHEWQSWRRSLISICTTVIQIIVLAIRRIEAPFDYAQGDCQTERSRSLIY